MLSTLVSGDKIKYEGTCYIVIGIKSWRDQVHGTVYALDLEAEGKTRRISRVEGCG